MLVHVYEHLDVLFLYIVGVRILGQWRRRAAEAGEHDPSWPKNMERMVSGWLQAGQGQGDILTEA